MNDNPLRAPKFQSAPRSIARGILQPRHLSSPSPCFHPPPPPSRGESPLPMPFPWASPRFNPPPARSRGESGPDPFLPCFGGVSIRPPLDREGNQPVAI